MIKKEIKGLPVGCFVQESSGEDLFYLIFPGLDGTYHSAKFDHEPTLIECLDKIPHKVEEKPAEIIKVEPETKKSKKKDEKEECGEDNQD